MANEYLKRTPTSTGNRKVFTFSVWYKRLDDNGNTESRYFILAGNTHINLRGSGASNPDDIVTNQRGGSTNYFYHYAPARRDYSSWQHLLYAVDTTQSIEKNRGRVYINGVEQVESSSIGSNNASQNDDLSINDTVKHLISEDGGDDGAYLSSLQLFDAFLVDGQALTPDVFGFYKDGDGYQSSGSTKATDFRPGQWSPHSPRKIKTEIERKGGFGVNGFYLPMNDSSNFGADFHCTPNSIITLKGEDLPQPRNGAPTTSDAYVSQLRSDPYAANLILSVPGVNTQPTGSELVTNGTFDTNVSGWTITDTGTIVRQSDGTAKVTRGSSAEVVYQDITTVVNTTYELSVDITDIAGSHGQVYVKSTPHSGSIDTNIGYSFYTGTYKGTFTADTTTTRIILYAHPSGSTSYDNVSVKATTIPDYSADIKGSGTNKTLTVNGESGIRNNDTSGSAVNGYYGSALHFDGTGGGDYIDTGYSIDGTFGSGDYTIECWIHSLDDQGERGIFGMLGSQYGISLRQFGSYAPGGNRTLQAHFGQSATGYTTGTTVRIQDQWNHVAMVKEGTIGTLYLNGVAVGIANNVSSTPYSTSNLVLGIYHSGSYPFRGYIQDFRVYTTAKYKGGFDVPKPYAPVGIESWRQVSDTCKNNFATLNPLSYQTTGTYGSSVPALTNGNLTYTHGQTGQWERSNSTMGVGEGKWYFEFEVVTRPVTGNSENWAVGLRESDSSSFYGETDAFEDLGDHVYWIDAGTAKIVSNQDRSAGSTSGITAVANGDIINIAFEKTATALKVWFGKNGTYFNSGNPATGSNPAVNHSTTSTFIIPAVAYYQYSGQEEPVATFNFGQNPAFSGTKTAGTNADSNGEGLFKYQPPTDFLALCEDNLSTPTIADPGEHFKTVLYTGNGSARGITGVGFKPDFVWIKNRDSTYQHQVYDSVRGAGQKLLPSNTNAESTDTANVSSFDSNGFSFAGGNVGVNQDTKNHVAWCWKAGGAAVSNTDGSITSQVSVNQTAGFSIVSYTGNGTSGTVGHGLGKTPNIVICKNRTDASTNWSVNGNVAGLVYGTNKLLLQATNAIVTDTNEVTGANATTITLGNSSATNDTNDAQIAYCWTEIEGFSKFGSYLGNGNTDGPFVYCGFKPAWVMIKLNSCNKLVYF